ncbi:MAG TPA: hypothetical protein ENK52_06665, partial [Saprospiraceae bacterium]|nr:hypothetical protein [Saprospiraceae bacterium]
MFREFRFSMFILFFLVSLNAPLSAQTCIDFEDFENEAFYAPPDYQAGDIVFTSQDIPVSLDSFVYTNGTKGLWGLKILYDFANNGVVDSSDQALWISNTVAIFDFDQLAQTSNKVSFDFWNGGGDLNFTVNDHTLYLLDNFHELPTQIAPGVSYSVVFDEEPYPGIGYGTIILEGNIHSLLIGGQEFTVDNVCAYPSTGCLISDLVVNVEDCTPNNVFFVNIDFDANNMSSDSFEIRGNGHFYGTFAYADRPIRLGPLAGDGTTPYEFVIIDSENNDCKADYNLGKINCNP